MSREGKIPLPPPRPPEFGPSNVSSPPVDGSSPDNTQPQPNNPFDQLQKLFQGGSLEQDLSPQLNQFEGEIGSSLIQYADYYPAEQSQQGQSGPLQTLPTGSYYLGSSGDASESTSADGTVELGSVATYATQPGYHQYDAPDFRN